MSEIIKKRFKWIEYEGVKILLNDYTNLTGENFIETLEILTEHFLTQQKKEILLLLDVRNSYSNKEIIEALNIASKRIKPLVKKSAVLGVTGVKKILLTVVNKVSDLGAKPFNTEDEAKEWLVSLFSVSCSYFFFASLTILLTFFTIKRYKGDIFLLHQ